MKAAAVIHNSNPITQDLDKITYQLVTKLSFFTKPSTHQKRGSECYFQPFWRNFSQSLSRKKRRTFEGCNIFSCFLFCFGFCMFLIRSAPSKHWGEGRGRPALLARRALLYALFGALNVFPFLCFFCYTIRIRFFSQIGILGRQSFSMLCYNNKKVLYIHHNNTQWVLATNCSWL